MPIETIRQPSRFVVGIDLGTTNSALTYVDTAERPWKIRTFAVPRLVAPGQVEARDTLPSFHYEPTAAEAQSGAFALPWSNKTPTHAVGCYARDHGALTPGRLVNSAKSWLCHAGVDRTAGLLPWRPAADVAQLSPVEISARILRHMGEAWNAEFPKEPLCEQEIVLTLPASFDEVARELTVAAAKTAGLPRVVLIEEPQAAFYAWIDAHREDWQERVEPGQKILVCDIGGGTSDFTLIRVRGEADGRVRFHRVAVGDHLILGGDNLDLALAHHLEGRITGGKRLDPKRFSVLVRVCRQAKETLLSDAAPEKMTLNLPGSGTRLIGGATRIEVDREEVQSVLVEGFLPKVGLEEKPRERASGFQEFGLPYAPDAGITRHLAAFLTAHRHVAMEDLPESPRFDPARPDIVLFNGGFFESMILRERLLSQLAEWFRDAKNEDWAPIVLQNDRLDLAVARGAAYFGMVRRGEGVRIAAGLARTYFIGVEGEEPAAVCLVPAGTEPGNDVDLTSRTFQLRTDEPVEFPLFVSSTRLTDKPGDLIPIDREQLTPLPPIRTVLRTKKKASREDIAVQLHARLTEIGTLDLWCGEAEGKQRWRLQFDVRSTTQTDVAAHEGAAEREGFVDEATWEACEEHIRAVFGDKPAEKPGKLVRRLSDAVGSGRDQWPASLLRRMWDTLMECESGRKASAAHETRWLNLIGFTLRPGYGMAVDDWRVNETFRTVQGNIQHAGTACQAEGWILWRRIAGGLTAGQQAALADPLIAAVRALHRQVIGGKHGRADFDVTSNQAAEAWRMLGALELLRPDTKLELGQLITDLLPRRRLATIRGAVVWALGRIGARQPSYGPLNRVVPPEEAETWLKQLMSTGGTEPEDHLAAMQLARRTDDRYRDISDKLRDKVLGWLEINSAPDHFRHLVAEADRLSDEETDLVFGESLPKGLRI